MREQSASDTIDLLYKQAAEKPSSAAGGNVGSFPWGKVMFASSLGGGLLGVYRGTKKANAKSKKVAQKSIGKLIPALIGAGTLAGGTIGVVKGMKHTKQEETQKKSASEMIDELYMEKEAGAGKNMAAIGLGSLGLMAGGNLLATAVAKKGFKGAHRAIDAEQSGDEKKYKKAKKGALIGGALFGPIGAGWGADMALNKYELKKSREKSASEMIDELSLEKEALSRNTKENLMLASPLLGAGALAGGLHFADSHQKKKALKEIEKDPRILNHPYLRTKMLMEGSNRLPGFAMMDAVKTIQRMSSAERSKSASETLDDLYKEASGQDDLAKILAKTLVGTATLGIPVALAKKGKEGAKKLGKQLLSMNKKASDLLEELYKVAEMNVPTEEEKKKESNVVTNDDDLADITCEVCDYQGKPDHHGYCPKCGALGGIALVPKPKDVAPVDAPMDPEYRGTGNIYEESAYSFEA